MIELDRAHYDRIVPLLGELAFQQEIHAILAGLSPGQIWADRHQSPNVALVWGKSNAFLCGSPPSKASVRALQTLLRETLYPAATEEGRVAWSLRLASDWRQPLAGLERDLAAVADTHRCYVYHGRPITWEERLPAGFSMLPVDAAFLQRPWQLLDDLREWLVDCWVSQAAYEQHSLGRALVHGDQVVGACLAEYPTENACDLGIFTNEPFRRQGFALLTASACINACLQRGWTPHWHTWESNRGSIAVAEKLGLQLLTRYSVLYAWYHPIDNLVVNGNIRLWRGDAAQAVIWYQQAVARAEQCPAEEASSRLLGRPEIAKSVYGNIARAHVATGQWEHAFEALRQSGLRGGYPLDQWLQSEELDAIREHPQWELVQQWAQEQADHLQPSATG